MSQALSIYFHSTVEDPSFLLQSLVKVPIVLRYWAKLATAPRTLTIQLNIQAVFHSCFVCDARVEIEGAQ